MKKTAVFAAAALLAACAQTQSDHHAAAPANGLDGKWQVSHVDGHAPADGQGVLSFDAAAGRYALNVGCNNLFGGFTQPAGGLLFGPVASTLKMCDETTMRLERRAIAVLGETRGYRRQGQRLELLDAGGKPLLDAVAE